MIPDAIRVAVTGNTPSGTPWVNVLHFEKDPGATFAASIPLIHTQLDLLYGAGSGTTQGWADTASTSARAENAAYTPLDGITATTILPLANPGTDAAEPMPADSAVVFTHRTAFRGPRNRGRTYWAGYCEDVNVAGRPNTATTTGQVAAWDAMRTALAALTPPIRFSVASYTGLHLTDVIATTCDNVWDRQRRRRP